MASSEGLPIALKVQLAVRNQNCSNAATAVIIDAVNAYTKLPEDDRKHALEIFRDVFGDNTVNAGDDATNEPAQGAAALAAMIGKKIK